MTTLKTAQNTMPHLYLDMDGVQADFFKAWADQQGVSHYKEIPHPEDAINELATSSPENVYNFFRTLRPLAGGKHIIKWLHDNNVPFTVLSAPLRGPYQDSSIQAKRDWLDEHNPGTSNTAIFTSKKFNYAVTDGVANVLVDDFGKYIDAWTEAGGIPVKHDNETTGLTIKMLNEIYAPYLDK
jgi:5' nucleotidase, deoxy (Pyrimidine), cytosolic type C protein (NT5C)